MSDETNAASSAADESNDESLESSGDGTETPEGEESIKAIPYDRFKQVNDQRKEAAKVVDWYRQNVGDPNDVIEFKKWKSAQVEKAKEAESDGDITPAKLEQIRKLMRKADPEYAQFIEHTKQEAQSRQEAQFDSAEDLVRELASTELGLKGKGDEADVSWVGQQVMLVIKGDERLLRQWQHGNLDCVKKAFKVVQERHDKIGKSLSKARTTVADKRRISKLPTLPSGSGGLTQKSAAPQEKGITKDTHRSAWAIMQSHQE